MFQLTVDPATKPAPVTVSRNDGLPAVTEFGLSDVITGDDVTVNAAEFDSALPGFSTVKVSLPGLATNEAGIVSVSSVGETTVVGMGLLFHCATDFATYPEP